MGDEFKSGTVDPQAVISGKRLPADDEAEILSLRPTRLTEYIGQREIVETLNIALRSWSADHPFHLL